MAQQVPAMTRRERRRLQTFDEIVQASRGLLRSGHDVSLRAVAAEMGMTAPALYRYIDSIDELHVLVARDICGDVIAAMAQACDHYRHDDPAARLAASATTLRCWALANRAEFQMAFANPMLALTPRPVRDRALELLPTEPEDVVSNPFAAHFAELFVALHTLGLIATPPSTDLDPGLRDIIEKNASRGDDPIAAALGAEGMGTLWLFKLAWIRLYGILMVEAFGQADDELVGSDVVFNTLMRETFASLGLDDSWDRLIKVSRETSSRVGALVTLDR
ncbi:TetR/AcrR family transcriptional regulator [Mycobacterium sp. BMJ-28]